MINAVALTFHDMKLEGDYRSQLRTKMPTRASFGFLGIPCIYFFGINVAYLLGNGIHNIHKMYNPSLFRGYFTIVIAYLLYRIISRYCIPTRYSELAVWVTHCMLSCFLIFANPFRVSSEPSIDPAMKSLLHRCGPDVTENYIDLIRLFVLFMMQTVMLCTCRLRVQFVLSWAVVVCLLVSALRVFMPIDDIGLHDMNVFLAYVTTVCVVIVSYTLESLACLICHHTHSVQAHTVMHMQRGGERQCRWMLVHNSPHTHSLL